MHSQPYHSVAVTVGITELSNEQPLACRFWSAGQYHRSNRCVEWAGGWLTQRDLGCLRHVQARYRWVQRRAQERDPRLRREPRDANESDAFTKHLDDKGLMQLLAAMRYEFKEGRTTSATK